jgi:hypothetical protein
MLCRNLRSSLGYLPMLRAVPQFETALATATMDKGSGGGGAEASFRVHLGDRDPSARRKGVVEADHHYPRTATWRAGGSSEFFPASGPHGYAGSGCLGGSWPNIVYCQAFRMTIAYLWASDRTCCRCGFMF